MNKFLYLAIPFFVLFAFSCDMSNSPQVYTLTTETTPADGGTISPSGGEFEAGTEVTIKAEPAEGYLFVRWTSGYSGSDNPASVTFDGDKKLTAVFELKKYALNINIQGGGTVTEEIVQEKARDYEHGTTVRLTAEAEDGWTFTGWEGDLEGQENPETITVDEEKEITAVFERREYALNITVEGEGTVDEEVVQEKTRDYEHGTTVRLTANPAEGWSFLRWEGDLEGSENPETITIEEESAVTAVFSEDEEEITVSTTEVSDITATSAVSGGNVSSGGGTTVTARGVCRNTGSSPDINDTCTDDGAGTGSFTSTLSDLNPSTTYYIRAFATTDQETAYGEERSFTTAEPEELIIMPLGNSMTNDSRSRVKLWNLLTDDGYSVDYVGDQHQTSSIPDPDHEGVGGIEIQGIIDKAASLMERHDPEYVTLMVGTNDIAWHFDEPAADIADRWNQLIQLLLDHSSSDTYIIAATIPPVTSKQAGSEDMEERDRAVVVARFNEELRDYIETRRKNGDNIVLADMEAALDKDRHLADDGVHLNEEGYAIMGTVYYEALTAVLSDDE